MTNAGSLGHGRGRHGSCVKTLYSKQWASVTVVSRVFRRAWVAATVTLLVVAAGGLIWKLSMRHTPTEVQRPTTIHDVVPAPESVIPADGVTFAITEDTEIRTTPGSAEATQIGEHFAGLIRPGTGYPLPVVPDPDEPRSGGIALVLVDGTAEQDFGDEGYELEVTAANVAVRANAPAGLFPGVQTLRQTPAGEHRDDRTGRRRPVDHARRPHRGLPALRLPRRDARRGSALLRCRRGQAVIDLAALYKVNYLHLHLTDDQGWRIAIDSLAAPDHVRRRHRGRRRAPAATTPRTTTARSSRTPPRHYITVVPEMDLPGHTNAALASYAELNCDGVAPPLYTGIEVGFSSLCIDKEVTYRFLDEVFGELAALTPGPYLHIGGDEANRRSTGDDYSTIVTRAQEIVAGHGKTVIGWHEIAAAKLLRAPSRSTGAPRRRRARGRGGRAAETGSSCHRPTGPTST